MGRGWPGTPTGANEQPQNRSWSRDDARNENDRAETLDWKLKYLWVIPTKCFSSTISSLLFRVPVDDVDAPRTWSARTQRTISGAFVSESEGVAWRVLRSGNVSSRLFLVPRRFGNKMGFLDEKSSKIRLSGTISTTQTTNVSTKFLKFGPPINSISYRRRVTEVFERDERRVSTSFELISRYDNWITSRAASNNEKRGEDRVEAEPGIERQAACDEPPRPFVTPPRRPAVTDLFVRSETRMIPLRHSHIPRWRG